jgi:lysophospholipase L1-like esterase
MTLNNTIYRLKHKKQLRVGYFGGSITEGSGATDWNKTSWRGRINEYLKQTYPDVEFTEIQAAIGGTGTDFGHCRCHHDLLSHNPDLVFVEFATNDWMMPTKDQMSYYENCLRQIIEHDSTIDIICVFTTTKAIDEHLRLTGDHGARSVQATLAHYYDLPTVDIGYFMRRAVSLAGDDWLRYTTDNTHPNDDGYQIYTDVMVKAMDQWLGGEVPTAIVPPEIPEPLCREPLVAGRMVDLRDIPEALGEFVYVDRPFVYMIIDNATNLPIFMGVVTQI